MYKIFIAQYGGWQLEGETSDKQIARKAVKTLRASGRMVMVEFNGKKVSWKI